MQNFPQQSNYNDEIDLFELFETIWQGKWLIIAITMLGIILAGAYAFTAKEQWTSQAQVRVSEPAQLERYLKTEESFYRFAMLDNTSNMDTQKSLENAFTIFSTGVLASDERLEAISQTDYYQTLSHDLETDTERLLLLNKLATSNFSASQVANDNPYIYNLKFSAETPDSAQKALSQIIEHINKKTLSMLYNRLENRIDNRILYLEANALQLKNRAEQSRSNKILDLKQALQTARDANINDYTGNSPVIGNSIIDLKDSEMLFMLGEKYLQAQLNTLLNTDTIYPEQYYAIQHNIENLKTLADPEAQGQMFSYSQTPQLPLTKDKPRKALILILGALLGGVVGTLYVLLRSALNNRRKAQQA